jgi:hypothetical protein
MVYVVGSLVSAVLLAAALWYIVFSATKAGVRQALKEERSPDRSLD